MVNSLHYGSASQGWSGQPHHLKQVLEVLTNERRVLGVFTNKRLSLSRRLANERKVSRVLTNERRLLPAGPCISRAGSRITRSQGRCQGVVGPVVELSTHARPNSIKQVISEP